MSKNILCGVCEKGNLVLENGPYKTKIGRTEIELSEISYMKCNKCGEKAFTSKQLRESEGLAKDKYRKIYDLLNPIEIYEIRKNLGLTQKELANILGCGEVNFSRWENGKKIQSKFVDNMLRVFQRYSEVVDFLKERSDYNEDDSIFAVKAC